MAYVKVPAVFAKLEKAEKNFRPAILLASAGCGKTAAVRYYYRNKAVLWLSGLSGSLNAMPDLNAVGQGIVVVDDISWLTDTASEEYILELLRRCDRQIVLIGRGHFPAWLAQIAFDLDFVRVTERDLILTDKLIARLFAEAGTEISEADAEQIFEVMRGYPPAVSMCLTHVEQGQPVSRATFAEIRIELFHFYEKAFFELWKEPVREMLLAVCRYPEFSPELAELLSERRDVAELLEYCRNIGSFLERKRPGVYTLRDELQRFLCWKQEILWSSARIEENYRRAGYYFKKQGRIVDALFYYEKAGATDLIQQALIENVEQHPGVGQYYELRAYYEFLPEALILESPTLMAGMSMLYSLTMRTDRSEAWYRSLEAYEKQAEHPHELCREAKARLAYLDIALPHRAGRGLIGILKRIYTLQQSNNITLPEFAVTGNCPSVMNGGLDFCDWAKNGEQIARFMAKPLEALLGRFSKGLVNVALAESGFERSTMSPYEVVTRLNNGYAAADNGGKIEICFAAQGVLIRQHLAQGQRPTAARLLGAFQEKAEREGATQLALNIQALSAWLSLYTGGSDEQEAFLEALPDIHTDFYIARRYRYSVAIRCLIARERYAEAMDLASYLTHYYEEYRRTYLWIENELLKAIILYRQGEDEWRRVLAGALTRAEEYRLTRVFSMEGGAALPLLSQMKPARDDDGFLQEIERQTREMALFYPDYLKHTPRASVTLTAREQEILGMLLAGSTTEQICAACGISYSGLKKHNRSIYAKLGVKTRAEAERMALRLGLTHRKDVVE